MRLRAVRVSTGNLLVAVVGFLPFPIAAEAIAVVDDRCGMLRVEFEREGIGGESLVHVARFPGHDAEIVERIGLVIQFRRVAFNDFREEVAGLVDFLRRGRAILHGDSQVEKDERVKRAFLEVFPPDFLRAVVVARRPHLVRPEQLLRVLLPLGDNFVWRHFFFLLASRAATIARA